MPFAPKLSSSSLSDGKRISRMRIFVAACCLVCNLGVLSAIWFLTEQTPEETMGATAAAVYAMDDVVPGTGASETRTAESAQGSEVISDTRASDVRKITIQPTDAVARQGDEVTFSVEAHGAVSYSWECTDPDTDGWYEPPAGDAGSASLSFELTPDLTWLKDCTFRCRVAFDDGSVEYTDEAHIEYRDLAGWYKFARRAAHVLEFLPVGVFSAGFAIALFGRCTRPRRIVLAVPGFCLLCSVGDQVHKLFVPGREFDALDLVLDAIGYGAGIAIALLVGRLVIPGGNRSRTDNPASPAVENALNEPVAVRTSQHGMQKRR